MSTNFLSNQEYRNYLTRNADNIIKQNQILSHVNCSNTNDIPNMPESENSDMIENNKNRIAYLKKLFIWASMSAPTIKF